MSSYIVMIAASRQSALISALENPSVRSTCNIKRRDEIENSRHTPPVNKVVEFIGKGDAQ